MCPTLEYARGINLKKKKRADDSSCGTWCSSNGISLIFVVALIIMNFLLWSWAICYMIEESKKQTSDRLTPFYPIHSWRFCQKKRFEASWVVFWSLSCYKELKLTTNPFTGHTLRGLLIQMQNISLRSSGMRRKQNFDIVFGFKSDTAALTFTFRFLSSPLFSSCWAFS